MSPPVRRACRNDCSDIEFMKISVILCTYNRSGSLARALESVAASIVPESIQWEVLVVDNNSKDSTRDVVEAYCRRFAQRIRYIFEGRQGKSYALNTGILEAAGEVIAFMDDDVTVEPAWLQNLTEPLQTGLYMGSGGRICAPQDVLLPPWIALEGPCSLAGVLALFDRGPIPIELSDPPYGTNMAFRKEVFEKFGVFRTDLGPSVGSEIRGEDTELCLRLMRSGIPLLYVPTAIVYHEVPPKRLQKEYFLKWYFDYGRAFIRTRERKADVGVIPRALIGIMNHLLVMLPEKTFRWLETTAARERFFAKTQVWMVAGEAAELYNQWSAFRASRKVVKSHALS